MYGYQRTVGKKKTVKGLLVQFMNKNENILKLLESIANPNCLVLIGLGNPDRSDDGFGIHLVKRLKDRYPDQVFSEQEKSVEGIVLEILEREEIDTFVFVDATDFGGNPGELELFTLQIFSL